MYPLIFDPKEHIIILSITIMQNDLCISTNRGPGQSGLLYGRQTNYVSVFISSLGRRFPFLKMRRSIGTNYGGDYG